jgi:hypothetical protein
MRRPAMREAYEAALTHHASPSRVPRRKPPACSPT